MSPKTKKKPTNTIPSKPVRTVYEVNNAQGRRQIEANTTAELAELLTPLLSSLEPYAIRAVARLVSMERATVTASAWSVKRLGVLVFEADEQPARSSSQKASKVPVDSVIEAHPATEDAQAEMPQ